MLKTDERSTKIILAYTLALSQFSRVSIASYTPEIIPWNETTLITGLVQDLGEDEAFEAFHYHRGRRCRAYIFSVVINIPIDVSAHARYM